MSNLSNGNENGLKELELKLQSLKIYLTKNLNTQKIAQIKKFMP